MEQLRSIVPHQTPASRRVHELGGVGPTGPFGPSPPHPAGRHNPAQFRMEARMSRRHRAGPWSWGSRSMWYYTIPGSTVQVPLGVTDPNDRAGAGAGRW